MTEPIDITLLTQNTCGFCDQAKDALRRLGHDYPLRVTEVHLASDEGQRLATQAGVLFAPGVLIDGESFSFGRLSERKLRRELDRRLGAGSSHG